MPASKRVRRSFSEIHGPTEDENNQLETELLAEGSLAERAWGMEIDRRAARVLAGEASGLRRDEVRALLAMSPADARARLAAVIDAIRPSR